MEPIELPRPTVEERLAAIMLRTPVAVSRFTGSAEDLDSPIPQEIVRAALKAVERKLPGGPSIANISELSGIPESELRQLAYTVTPDVASEFETYAARVKAEGYKSRKLKAFEEAHAQMARTNWRDVEMVGALTNQNINKVRLGAQERGKNDVGNVLGRIRQSPDSVREPIPFPWDWFNTMLKGGLGPSQKLYYVGPPGSRKSTWLYNALVFWGRIGERVVHFAFDGGSIEAQSAKIHTILWREKVEIWNQENRDKPVDFYTLVDTGGSGYANYPYINDVTTWDILRDRLEFQIPPMALELYWAAYDELLSLTADGDGQGRITLVSASECLSNFSLMQQRLRSEQYDGMTIWSMDNFTKGSGKYNIGLDRADELVQTLHTFTDESKIPMVMLAHMNSEAIKDIETKEERFIKYGASAEEDCDYQLLAHYDKAQPQFLKVSMPKNRDEASGNQAVFTRLHIEPKSGYIQEIREQR